MSDPLINGLSSTAALGWTPATDSTTGVTQPDNAFSLLLQQELAGANASPSPGATSGGTSSASEISPQLAEAWVSLLMQNLPVPGLSDTTSNGSMSGIGLTGTMGTSSGQMNPSALLELLQLMASPSTASALANYQSQSAAAAYTGAAGGGISTLDNASIAQAVQAASAKYGVPSNLIQAVIDQESGGNPGAVSSAGALGLMQLMPDTAQSLGVTSPLDPAENVDGGTRYLASLLRQFNGSVPLALAAYNAGPNAVLSHSGIPPYPETQNYVKSVMAKAQNFSAAV